MIVGRTQYQPNTNSTMLGWKTPRGCESSLQYCHLCIFYYVCMYIIVPLFSCFTPHVVILSLIYSLLAALVLFSV